MSTEPSSSTTRATAASTCVAVGHVAANGEGAPAERPDLLHRLLRVHHPLRDGRLRERPVALRGARVRLDEDVRDRDVGARPGERQRVGAPEPARAAGDESDAPGEVDLERHGARSYAPSAGRLASGRTRGMRRTRRGGAARAAGCLAHIGLPPRAARPTRSRRRAQSWRSTRPTPRPSSSRPGRGRATSRRTTSSGRSTRSGRSSGCSACAGRSGWCHGARRRSSTRRARGPWPRASGAGWSSSSRRAASPSDPAAWLDDGGGRGARRRSRRAARRSRSDLTRGRPAARDEAPPRRPERAGRSRQAPPARILPLLAAEGAVVRGRPRGAWTRPVALGAAGRSRSAARPDTRHRRRPGRAPPPLAACLRARRRRRTSAGGRVGRRARRGQRSRPHRTTSSSSTGRPATCSPTTSSRVEPPAPCGGAPPDARPDDDGLEGARLVPRPARGRRSSTATATPGRRCGGTAASSAAGRSGEDGEIVWSCSRTSAPRPRTRSRRRPSGSQRWLGDVRFAPGFLPPFQRVARALTDDARSRELRTAKRAPSGVCPAAGGGSSGGIPLLRNPAREQGQPRKISFAITSRWICEVPS